MSPKNPDRLSSDDIVSIIVKRMEDAHWDKAFIHAFQVTGMLIAEGNQHLFSKKDRKRWNDAVEEYRREHPEKS